VVVTPSPTGRRVARHSKSGEGVPRANGKTFRRKAMIYGSALASFCVEAFSLERLRNLPMDQINERYETFKLMSQFEVST
jgi:hypothetical protein